MKNKFAIISIFSAVITFLSLEAMAADACRKLESFRNEAKSLVYQAQASDLRGIDGYTYSEIVAALDKPCLKEVPKGFVIQADGREGAIYEPTDKVIYLNSKPLKMMSAEQRRTLILHELLGASGFPDRDYQMTLQIVMLGQEGAAASAAMKSVLAERSVEKKLSSGSGTSVGGGGDIRALRIKMALLQALRKVPSSEIMIHDVVRMAELVRLVLECPLEIRDKGPLFQSGLSTELFINGVIKPGDPSFRLHQALMLNTFVHKDWEQKITQDALASGILHAMIQAIAGKEEKVVCNIPFFPYVKVSTGIEIKF